MTSLLAILDFLVVVLILIVEIIDVIRHWKEK